MAKQPAATAAYDDDAYYLVRLNRVVVMESGTKYLPRYVHEMRGRLLKTIAPEAIDNVQPVAPAHSGE